MTQIEIQPTPACAAFEELLPLLDTDALTAGETQSAEQHIAGCAWCQAQRTGYATFESALHRHYSASTPAAAELLQQPFTLDDILYADETATPAIELSDALADDADEEDGEDDELEISPIVPARPHMRAVRPPRRWKPIRLAEIAAVLVVALLATTLLVSRLGPAGTQSPLKSAAGAVVFAHSVSWGTLTINGKSTRVASDGRNPLYLPAGHNSLVYTAPPLPAIRCTISAPAAHDDTCHIYTGDPMISPDDQYNGRIIDLEMAPDRLTTAQRDALAAVAQRALDANAPTIQILPGDHFAAPEGTALTASQAFPMTLHFQVAANSFGPDIGECTPFCRSVATSWSIQPTIYWTYTYQQGQQATPTEGWSAHPSLDIPIQWDGRWKVSLESAFRDFAVCQIAATELQQMLVPNVGWGYGCPTADAMQHGTTYLEVTFSRSDTGNSTEIAHMLYRAGLWIALDSNAHYLFPSLPGPSAHENSIARSLGYTH